MDRHVILCADSQSLRNPEMIGLAGEPLDSYPWLACVCTAEECRSVARGLAHLEEAWVVSCDDMDPINVAAALKMDNHAARAFLVSCGQNGSLASRASQARIDGIWSESRFLRRYAQAKTVFSQAARSGEIVLPRSEALALENSGSMPRHAALPVVDASSLRAQPHNAQEGSGAPFAFDPAQLGGGAVETEQSQDQGEGPSSNPAPLHGGTGLAPKRKAAAIDAQEGTVIAVVSGSGGCGKSTLATLFSLIAAASDLSVAVLDADLQFGDVHHMLGIQEPLRIEDAIEEPARVGLMTQTRQKGKPALIAAPRRLETAEAVVAELPLIVDALRSDYDVVVVNTGSFWSDVQAIVLDRADAVVLLMDQRPSSLRASVHAVELCARLGVATNGFTFAVNRHVKDSLLSSMDVSCALHGAKAVELADGGREVDEMMGAGYSAELLLAGNPLLNDVADLLGQILPEEKAAQLVGMRQRSKKRRWLRRERRDGDDAA